MKEYRVKKGVRIFSYILWSFLILILGGMTIAILFPFNAITEEIHQFLPGIWRPLLFMTMIVIMIIGMIAIKKRRVIITDESITLVGFLKNKELKFTEIKGFNTVKNPKIGLIEDITIEPIDRSKKTIMFNNTIENYLEIKSVLNAKLTDLDREKKQVIEKRAEEEKQEILTNTDFGFTIEERQDKLNKARLFSMVLNGLTIAVGLWLFFYPRPYKYAVIACISLPLIGFLSVKFWKGLIQIDVEKDSAYPTAAFPILFPGLILGLRVMLDFSIENYTNIWIPAIVISCIYVALIIVSSKKMSFKNAKAYFSILSYVVFGFLYGYSTVIATNCVFDHSEPKVFASEVLSKTINESRKSTTYYLNLSPWGEKTEAEKISVDSDLYNNIHTGDEVSVYQFKGRLDIPWVVVDYAR